MTDLPADAFERLLEEARPLLDEHPAAAPGVLLRDRYRLLREVGRGGMGAVFEAQDTELDRRVAIKVLHLASSAPGLSAQVMREARAAARLDHPGIAAVHDAFADDEGEAIVLQFVEGAPLSSLPRPSIREAAAWIRDAARAVHHAHEQGIVHRDLKPHNLMHNGERIVVTDFGLAKELALESSLSLSGSVLGTPAYMPPEQAGGRAREVDATSDVYALGATLYELLAGRPPFVDKDLVQLLKRIVDETPVPLQRHAPKVPRDLAVIVHACLEKERARRYPSAEALAEDLQRWLDGQPIVARAPTLSYRARTYVARNRRAFAAGTAALSVLALALAGTWIERSQRHATAAALALSEEVNTVRRDAALFETYAREGEQLGQRDLALARLDQGIEACRTFLQRHDVAAGHFLLGRLLRARGFREEAEASLDRALDLDETLEPARLERGLVRAAGHFALAVDASPSESLAQRARADFERVDFESLVLGRIDVQLGRAYLAWLEGDHAAADAGFREVLRSNDVYAEIEANMALTHLSIEAGDMAAALRFSMSQVDLARGFGPAHSTPPVSVESIARLTSELEASSLRQSHDRAVDSAPFDARLRAERGFYLLDAGVPEEGRADLEAALFLGASGDLRVRIEERLAD